MILLALSAWMQKILMPSWPSPEGFNGFIKNMLTSYEDYMTPKLVEQVFLSLLASRSHIRLKCRPTSTDYRSSTPITLYWQSTRISWLVISMLFVVRVLTRACKIAWWKPPKRSYRQLRTPAETGNRDKLQRQQLSPSTEVQKPVQKVALAGAHQRTFFWLRGV